MSLIWNKIEPNESKDYLLRLQNKSLIPDSIVYYTVSDREPSDETTSLVLVSRQVSQLTLEKGKTLWYSVKSGGIFVSSKSEINKLENYNITTKQESISLTDTPVTVTVPEGATITFQNLSNTNAGFKFSSSESVGSFVLSLNQIFSESFALSGVVTFMPSNDKKPSEIVYSITPSAVITKLSNDMKTFLDELDASMKLLNTNAVTHDELTAFVSSTYHNKWSSPSFKQVSMVDSLVSRPFIGNTSLFFSEPITSLDEFNLLIDINVTYLADDDVTTMSERGLLSVCGSYRDSGTYEPVSVDCNNVNIAKIVDSVTLEVTENRNEVTVIVNLNKTMLTSGTSTMVRFEHGVYESEESDSEAYYITNFNVDAVNRSIGISEDSFTAGLLNTIDLSSNDYDINTCEVAVVSNSYTTINDKIANDFSITSNTINTVIRDLDGACSILCSYYPDELPIDLLNVKLLDFINYDYNYDKVLNLTQLISDITSMTDEGTGLATITISLCTINRTYDYIREYISHLLNNKPKFVDIYCSKEV